MIKEKLGKIRGHVCKIKEKLDRTSPPRRSIDVGKLNAPMIR